MTTTLDRTITRDIAPGTRVVNQDDPVQIGEFVAWAENTSDCALVHIATHAPGVESHTCGLSREWQLADEQPTVVPDATDRRDQQIADLRTDTERMAQVITELRESLELRTNERDMAQRRITEYERTVTEYIERWDRCWERLGDEAESRGWCSEYDDIAEELGGPRRHEYVTAYCTVHVTSELDSNDLMAALGHPSGELRDVDCSDYATVEWQFSLSMDELQTRTGACNHEVNWDGLARQALENAGVSYRSFSTDDCSCDNCN